MASVTIERKWCPQCDAYVKAERHGASHLFHLVMTCVTVGLWLIVWFFVANGREFHCSTCGAPTRNRANRWFSGSNRKSDIILVIAFGIPVAIFLIAWMTQ